MSKSRVCIAGFMAILLGLPVAFIFRAAAVSAQCCFNQCANPNTVCEPYPTVACDDFSSDPPCSDFSQTLFEVGDYSCTGSTGSGNNCVPDGNDLCYTIYHCVFANNACSLSTNDYLFYYMPVYKTVACQD